MRPRIQHVSVPRPPGSEETARSFYGQLLGLQEVTVPESIRFLDLIWYKLGETELHLFASREDNPPSIRHFCIEVEDLKGLRERLSRGGYEILETTPIPGRPRFFCLDPFGNRIEFTTIEGDYSPSDLSTD